MVNAPLCLGGLPAQHLPDPKVPKVLEGSAGIYPQNWVILKVICLCCW